MPITTEFEYSIHASRNFVFDWFADLSSEDTKLAKPLKERKIISRSPSEIRLQDIEVILGKEIKLDVRVLFSRSDYSWTGIYTSNTADARSEYRLFAEGPDRTMLRYHSVIMPHGFFTKLVSPIIAYAVKRTFRSEFDGFKKAIELEFTEQARS